jgi:hypothetical protein
MINALKGLFGKTPAPHAVKKPATASKPAVSQPDGDFRAVRLSLHDGCCAAAKDTEGKRYLLREAPRLPLKECTMPTSCTCKFHKDADRRGGDRRRFCPNETNRWYAGPERRKRDARRTIDN